MSIGRAKSKTKGQPKSEKSKQPRSGAPAKGVNVKPKGGVAKPKRGAGGQRGRTPQQAGNGTGTTAKLRKKLVPIQTNDKKVESPQCTLPSLIFITKDIEYYPDAFIWACLLGDMTAQRNLLGSGMYDYYNDKEKKYNLHSSSEAKKSHSFYMYIPDLDNEKLMQWYSKNKDQVTHIQQVHYENDRYRMEEVKTVDNQVVSQLKPYSCDREKGKQLLGQILTDLRRQYVKIKEYALNKNVIHLAPEPVAKQKKCCR